MATQAQPQRQFLDPNSLSRGLQTLVRTVQWAAQVAQGKTNGNAYEGHAEREGNGSSNYQQNESDEFEDYDEEAMADGRLVRRYEDGTIRVENPSSGVMQEECPDGSLTVSLPGGKIIYQQYRGEPLLVYDSNGKYKPSIAQVSSVTMPGMEAPSVMFHFQDAQGTHLIELETLRYYRLNRAV